MVAVPTTDQVEHPLAAGYDLRLNNTLWQLAPTAEETVDVVPVDESEGVLRTQDNPEDFGVASDERSFSRESFSGGEGLARAHRRDGTDRDYTRYWSSEGIEVEPTTPGQPEVVRLSPSMDTRFTFPPSDVHLATIDGVLFAAHNQSGAVYRFDQPTEPALPATSETVGGGTQITALVRLGRELYANSAGQGVYRRTAAGTWGLFTDQIDADQLWGAKLRLLGRDSANPHELYEIHEGAVAPTLLVSLPEGSVWNDVTDAGEYVLAVASDGFVYAIGEDAGALQLEAQTEVEGEEPVAIREAQGVVLVATRQGTTAGGNIGRLWTANLNGPRLVDAQVIRTWGDEGSAVDWTPFGLAVTRSTAVIWVRTGAWRYHLETAGLHQWMAPPSPTDATAIRFVGGRLVVATADSSIIFQSDQRETTGYLITPAADFYSSKTKQWAGLALFHAALTSSVQRLRVYYSTDPAAITDPGHPSWRLALSRTGPTAPVDSEVPLSVRSRWLALKITFDTAGDQPSPRLYGFSVRAIPLSPDLQVLLPINISDWVDSPWRSRRRVPGLGRIRQSTLFGLRSANVEVELYRRDLILRGTAKMVSTPESVTTPGGSPTLRAMMLVKGRLIPTSGPGSGQVSGITYGIPMYGQSVFGG